MTLFFSQTSHNLLPAGDATYRRPGKLGWDAMQKVCADQGMRLCPRQKYCPDFNSVDSPGRPVYGATAGISENWAPVAEKDGVQDWVSVGTASDSLCKTHTELTGETAGWGKAGHSDKQVLLCCEGGAIVSGTAGAVSCSASNCDPDTKPSAKKCPKTPDCGPLLRYV